MPINRLDLILDFRWSAQKHNDSCGNETENVRDEHVKSIWLKNHFAERNMFVSSYASCIKNIWFLIDDSNWYRWKSITYFMHLSEPLFIHRTHIVPLLSGFLFSFVECVCVCVRVCFQSAIQAQYHKASLFNGSIYYILRLKSILFRDGRESITQT